MKKAIISDKEILEVSKQMVREKGLQAIHMRSVAQACQVSVGSIYNYYSSKNDLMLATITSIWQEIFHGQNPNRETMSFIDEVKDLFNCIQLGSQTYPFFFSLHSMSLAENDKEKGRMVMNQYFDHIKKQLLTSLQNDTKVKENVFTAQFTLEQFIDFVFSNLISLLLQQETSCDFLIAVIQKVIYE